MKVSDAKLRGPLKWQPASEGSFLRSFFMVEKEGKMKKRFKKALSMVLIMISILALFAQSAFAFIEGFSDEIDKANEKILEAVEKTQEKAAEEALKGNKSEEEFNEYLDKLIEKLKDKTEKTAEKLIEKAAKEGVTIEKTYKVFIIYDREVEIDPFYAH